MILLALGMVVSSVVGMFETVVTQLPIIMCFQSLILDMAGNVGTQSLAVTIRVLMDESLTGKQKAELVFKEMRIGLCNGGLLGLMSFVLIGLYIFAIKGKTIAFSYAVSACIGVALLLAMLISSAVGTCIPLLFKKIKVDPAVASFFDYDHQRPCCGSVLLRLELAVFDRVLPYGGLILTED